MRQGLPAHPSSVGRARSLIRSHLRGTALEPLADTAELVVSEVVTNAIVHTGAAIVLVASTDDTGLRVEVSDSGRHLPVMATYDTLASTGRGLRLVAELSDHWGVEARPGGKVFWFHIGLGSRDEDDPSTEMSTTGGDGDSGAVPDHAVDVVLLNMPTLIHGAWQQHAKSLLRDLLLLELEAEADNEIAAHAAAMDALAILEEQVGSPEASEDPTELLAAAVEPFATRARMHVIVPRESVPHFETLDRQLESALGHAIAGRLLTPPTQPELASFRRWLCEQVRVQADGRSPQPWTTPRGSLPPYAPATTWDGADVIDSSQALIGADNAGLIVAASAQAAALLKYETSDDLVGRRLVDIIPARYHQAHLAGFSLHQITGRGPLLNRAVVVPALCRDGSEIDVQLTIAATLAPGGGSIFVADLQHPPAS